MAKSTYYGIELPLILSISIDSFAYIIQIKSHADLTKYTNRYTNTDPHLDMKLDLNFVATGLSIDATFSEIKKDNSVKIKTEIDFLNTIITQVAKALDSSQKELMKAGKEHYDKITKETKAETKTETDNVMTYMMEYNILDDKLQKLRKTNEIELKDT